MSIQESIAQWRDAASEIELDQIDWEEPGTWPAILKVFSLVLTAIVVIALGYYFVVQNQFTELDRTKAIELSLKQEYEKKTFEAANLEALRSQMQEMDQMFGALVSQLPLGTQVPGLLEDITGIGSANGLEFNSLELQSEIAREFYVELPIDIIVTGTYHDLGAFVSGIASLPRIVTLHDFDITPVEGRAGVMEMVILAKTYRYKDES